MHGAERLQKESIYLMVYGKRSSKEVAAIKDVSESTLRNWKLHFSLTGESPAESRARRMKRGKRIHNRLVTHAVKVELRRIVTERPWMYLEEIREALCVTTGVLLSSATTYRVLSLDLNWSLKRATLAAKERNDIDRDEHLQALYNATNDPTMFIFVDETSKGREDSLRTRHWQPRGEIVPYGEYFNHGGNNNRYTMIGAADSNGFISEACDLIRRKANANDVDPEAGTVDADRFVEWVENQLVPVLGDYAHGQPRSIVVMDNATIHGDVRVRTAIEAAGALLMYQSAYSPDLNPIELCFNQYKSHLKRHHAEYVGDINLAHMHALGTVSSDNMKNYYRRVGGIRNVENLGTHHPSAAQVEEELLILVTLAVLVANDD